MTRLVDLAGQRFGRLVVISKAESTPGTTKKRTRWNCACDCGAEKTVYADQLKRGKTRSCGCLAREESAARARAGVPAAGRQAMPRVSAWKPVVGYYPAHRRVTSTRGRAAEHPCADCGCQAREWSYEGGCPNELTEMVKHRKGGRPTPRAYSLDVWRYSPRCRDCHVAFDHEEEAS